MSTRRLSKVMSPVVIFACAVLFFSGTSAGAGRGAAETKREKLVWTEISGSARVVNSINIERSVQTLRSVQTRSVQTK